MSETELPEHIKAYIKENLRDYGLQGWCQPQKAQAMCLLVMQTRAECVVEIGVFGGRSLIPMAMAMQVGTAFGIDPWETETAIEGSTDDVNNNWWKSVDLNDIMRGALDAIRKAGMEKRICVMPMHSRQAKKHFRKMSIDILHIDGCHSEHASMRDVVDWLPLVRHGGFIWMDDVNWASTAKAVAMLDKQCIRHAQIEEDGAVKCVCFRKTKR